MHIMRRYILGFVAALVAGPGLAAYATRGADTDVVPADVAATADTRSSLTGLT